jgi:hypothetical protein
MGAELQGVQTMLINDFTIDYCDQLSPDKGPESVDPQSFSVSAVFYDEIA